MDCSDQILCTFSFMGQLPRDLRLSENVCEHLTGFFQEVGHYAIKPIARTLFDIGGRGYYENAASDLLAFFMKPDEVHGLKSLFIEEFFNCMDENAARPDLTYVSILREQFTQGGGRIDILVLGKEWCLIIENKVRHFVSNPLELYEGHGLRFSKKKYYCAILSPDGKSTNRSWAGISYHSYCERLNKRLEIHPPIPGAEKWHLFANEFVLHLKNETSSIINMTPKQIEFVENHKAEIAQTIALKDSYIRSMLKIIQQELSGAMPAQQWFVADDKWAFRVRSNQWGSTDMVLFQDAEKSFQFRVRLYVHKNEAEVLRMVNLRLLDNGYEVAPEGGNYHYYTSLCGYRNSESAISEMCSLAKEVTIALAGNSM